MTGDIDYCSNQTVIDMSSQQIQNNTNSILSQTPSNENEIKTAMDNSKDLRLNLVGKQDQAFQGMSVNVSGSIEYEKYSKQYEVCIKHIDLLVEQETKWDEQLKQLDPSHTTYNEVNDPEGYNRNN